MGWLFNPYEPTGQPCAPGPYDYYQTDFADGRSAFDKTNLYTRGCCGNCQAVPQIWRLEVPNLPGNPYADDYAGVVYLRRIKYLYAGVFTGYFQDKCSWGQIADEPISGANTYTGPFGDGWALTFELNGLSESGFGWSLYSPAESGTIEFLPDAQTRWFMNGHFGCMQPNTLQRGDAVADHRFPYEPPFLTIVPFPG